jgi:hypothetical protein
MSEIIRAELARQIARCVETVRSAQAVSSREMALHQLMRLEAELAETDRAAARPEYSYALAAVPVT